MPSQIRSYLIYDKPQGYLGSYHAAVIPFTVAGPTAPSDYFSLRWTSTSALMVVLDASLALAQTTTSSAGAPTFGLFAARSFTASDTGGTAVTPSRKRAAYAASLVADARVGEGSALSAGTRTLDGSPIVAATSALAAGSVSPIALGNLRADPLVLAQDEGLVLRCTVAQTAGVTRVQLRVAWLELTAGSL